MSIPHESVVPAPSCLTWTYCFSFIISLKTCRHFCHCRYICSVSFFQLPRVTSRNSQKPTRNHDKGMTKKRKKQRKHKKLCGWLCENLAFWYYLFIYFSPVTHRTRYCPGNGETFSKAPVITWKIHPELITRRSYATTNSVPNLLPYRETTTTTEERILTKIQNL